MAGGLPRSRWPFPRRSRPRRCRWASSSWPGRQPAGGLHRRDRPVRPVRPRAVAGKGRQRRRVACRDRYTGDPTRARRAGSVRRAPGPAWPRQRLVPYRKAQRSLAVGDPDGHGFFCWESTRCPLSAGAVTYRGAPGCFAATAGPETVGGLLWPWPATMAADSTSTRPTCTASTGYRRLRAGAGVRWTGCRHGPSTRLGDWSDPALGQAHRLAYTRSIEIRGGYATVSSGHDYWGAMPDPFDPRFAQATGRAVQGVRDDPWLLGPTCPSPASSRGSQGKQSCRSGTLSHRQGQSACDPWTLEPCMQTLAAKTLPIPAGHATTLPRRTTRRSR